MSIRTTSDGAWALASSPGLDDDASNARWHQCATILNQGGALDAFDLRFWVSIGERVRPQPDPIGRASRNTGAKSRRRTRSGYCRRYGHAGRTPFALAGLPETDCSPMPRHYQQPQRPRRQYSGSRSTIIHGICHADWNTTANALIGHKCHRSRSVQKSGRQIGASDQGNHDKTAVSIVWSILLPTTLGKGYNTGQ